MKIEFTPVYINPHNYFQPPKPAKTKIPQWYKNMPNFVNDDNKNGLSLINNSAVNTTLKSCSPFLDCLTTGYIFELSADIEIRKLENNNLLVRWRTIDDMVTLHTQDQHPNFPTPQEGSNTSIFKWYNPFNIKTPKGYSCLFTHPFNRNELPFRTLSGIVDTDTYTNCVQFPFQILDFDEPFIIIEKGTPLAQIMPFKRDNWNNKVNDYDENKAKDLSFGLFSKIVRSYKTQYWHKKIYD